MYQVEQGIPAPAPTHQRKPGGSQKYPFCTMLPGESVYIPEGTTRSDPSGAAYKACRKVAQRKGWEFSAKSDEYGVRIWRIA